jgi:hypothetical protein
MTTSADDLQITYEAEAPTFGGFQAADFFVVRPHHPGLEVNLGIAQDARALFEATAGPLDAAQIQAILRALAGRVYRRYVDAGHEPPAILLLRAADIDAATVGETLADARIA